MSVNLDENMGESEFRSFIITQFHSKLTKYRESLKLTKLFADDSVESAIRIFYVPETNQTSKLDVLLREVIMINL